MTHYKRGRPKSAARACSCGTKGCKRDGNAHTALDARREPVPDRVVIGSKKSTRRWCKGVTGREHVPRWQPKMSWGYTSTEAVEQICNSCRKVLDICWPPYKGSPRWADWKCKCGGHR